MLGISRKKIRYLTKKTLINNLNEQLEIDRYVEYI